jgi:hypothetical protein
MEQRKMMKKTYATGEGSNPNVDFLSDIMPQAIDSVKSWTQVFEILEHEIINFPEHFSDEVDDTHGDKLRYIAQSELHKIVAWPILMSYNDMISWALENVDVQTKSIFNYQKVVVESF